MSEDIVKRENAGVGGVGGGGEGERKRIICISLLFRLDVVSS